MKKKKILLVMSGVLIMTLGVTLISSQNGSFIHNNPFLKATKVATLQKVGNSTVIVAKPKLLKDTMELPLSYFTETMEVLQLEDSEEALIGGGRVSISDNYILVMNRQQEPIEFN